MAMHMQSKQLPAVCPGIRVNAACPGHCRTKVRLIDGRQTLTAQFNNFTGQRDPLDGVRVVSWLALGPDGPDGQPVTGRSWCDHSPFSDQQGANAAEPDPSRWSFTVVPW